MRHPDRGAAKTALGNDYHALLRFDDALANRLLASAQAENEAFWRLPPLAEFHRNQPPFNCAELNTGSAAYPAGASTAAGFLSHFVETTTGAGCISTALRLTVKLRLNSGRRVRLALACTYR